MVSAPAFPATSIPGESDAPEPCSLPQPPLQIPASWTGAGVDAASGGRARGMVRVVVCKKQELVMERDYKVGIAWSEVMTQTCSNLPIELSDAKFMGLRNYLEFMPDDIVTSDSSHPNVRVGVGVRPRGG